MLTQLRTILRGAAKALGVERAAYAAMAAEAWPDLVGPEAAAATRVDGLRGGVLFVSARPGMWAQELSARRSQLAAALNAVLGERVIDDIRIRQGMFGSTIPPRPAQVTASRVSDEPGEDERAAIDRAVEEIQDPELREITKRVMTSQARWKRRRAGLDAGRRTRE